ncbi:hypothetical protein PDTK01_36880 [Phycicoccus sp. DTK01]|nr:hypothetical protein PDTK01_36880 [Phycicoccus sp. DTK01]
MGPITPMAELQVDEPSVTDRFVMASVKGWVGAAMTESERVAQGAVHAGAKWSEPDPVSRTVSVW